MHAPRWICSIIQPGNLCVWSVRIWTNYLDAITDCAQDTPSSSCYWEFGFPCAYLPGLHYSCDSPFRNESLYRHKMVRKFRESPYYVRISGSETLEDEFNVPTFVCLWAARRFGAPE